MSNANPEPVPITMLQLLEEEPLYSRKLVSPLFSRPQLASISFPSDIRVYLSALVVVSSLT